MSPERFSPSRAGRKSAEKLKKYYYYYYNYVLRYGQKSTESKAGGLGTGPVIICVILYRIGHRTKIKLFSFQEDLTFQSHGIFTEKTSTSCDYQSNIEQL